MEFRLWSRRVIAKLGLEGLGEDEQRRRGRRSEPEASESGGEVVRLEEREVMIKELSFCDTSEIRLGLWFGFGAAFLDVFVGFHRRFTTIQQYVQV
jgi:hypothetical protein